MHLLLITPQAAAQREQAQEDTMILSVRDYDVTSFQEAVRNMYSRVTTYISPTDRARLLALEIIHGMLLVLHPMLTAEEREEVLALSRSLNGRVVEMDDLPFSPPAHFGEWVDANRVRLPEYTISAKAEVEGYALSYTTAEDYASLVIPLAETTTWAQRMWERLLCLIEPLRHWAQRFDAHLGDSLKNPMTREALRLQQKVPRAYRCDTTPTTTG